MIDEILSSSWKPLESICLGWITRGELPFRLPIWDHLKEDFDELRRRAFKEAREWGSCIIWGDHGLGLLHRVRGGESEVSPSCNPEQHGDYVYVGFVHVHLPDPESGRPYPGFSELDFRATLADNNRLELVTNGPEVFALVRIADCTLPAQVVDDAEIASWRMLYDFAVATAGVSLEESLLEVNLELCRRLRLAFYQGLWGQPLQLVFGPLTS